MGMPLDGISQPPYNPPNGMSTDVDMRRYVALYSRVSVDFPSAPYIVLQLENCMVNKVLQFGKLMLDFVG
jgi:hypothetical protein